MVFSKVSWIKENNNSLCSAISRSLELIDLDINRSTVLKCSLYVYWNYKWTMEKLGYKICKTISLTKKTDGISNWIWAYEFNVHLRWQTGCMCLGDYQHFFVWPTHRLARTPIIIRKLPWDNKNTLCEVRLVLHSGLTVCHQYPELPINWII